MPKPTFELWCKSDPSQDPRPRRMMLFMTKSGMTAYLLSRPLAVTINADYIHCTRTESKIPRALRTIIGSVICALPLSKYYWRSVLRWQHGVHPKRNNQNTSVKLVTVHDIELLPDAIDRANDAPVLFDAREMYTEQGSQSWFFRYFIAKTRRRICEQYLPLCSSIITVSEGLIDSYKNSFGVDAKLMRSLPDYHSLNPYPPKMNCIRLVHHGVANSNRSLAELIQLTKSLDERFTLDLYLTGRPTYLAMLKNIAKNCPRTRILPPITYEEIIPTLNGYDIGLIFYPPKTENLKYCLPNKFFECVQARLAVAIGPSPDMSQLVEQYEIGLITEDFSFETLARDLNAWSASAIQLAKNKSDQAAKELCFEKEELVLERLLTEHQILPTENHEG